MKRSKRELSDNDEEEGVCPKKVKRKTKKNKGTTRQTDKIFETSESDTEIEVRRKKLKKKTNNSKRASKREKMSSENETESETNSESKEGKFPAKKKKFGHKKAKKSEKAFKREKESSESEAENEKIPAKKRKFEKNVSFEKQYECNVRSCKKTYTTPQGLSRHKKVHRKNWIFSCPHCKKGFDRSDHFTRHQKICPENDQKPSTAFITPEQLTNALSNFQNTMVNKLQGNKTSFIITNFFYLF